MPSAIPYAIDMLYRSSLNLPDLYNQNKQKLKKSRLCGFHKGTTFRANMQAYGKRKRVTRPDTDNARESYGVRTQRVPSGRYIRQEV